VSTPGLDDEIVNLPQFLPAADAPSTGEEAEESLTKNDSSAR
jgi:hypothetical protein